MPSNRVGLVLIHGFLSSPETWTNFIKLMRKDQELARLDYHPFQYASPILASSPVKRVPSIDDAASSLRTYMAVELRGYASVVLFTHSQGGLVAQRYLAKMLSDGRGYDLARIHRIIMFCCPNSGSQLALGLRRLAHFWKNPQERELRPLNEAIVEAQRTVLNQVVHASGIAPHQCPIPIRVFAGETDAIVPPASARSVFPDVGTLPGDHFSIIKPDSYDHRSYSALRVELLTVLNEIDDAAPGRRADRGQSFPIDPVENRHHGDEFAQPRRKSPDSDEHSDVISPGVDSIRGRLSPSQRALVINKLLAVPGIVDPQFRQEVYNSLPPAVLQQLPRQSVVRLEVMGLVRTFDSFSHLQPWDALATTLIDLLGDQPAVRDLIAVLIELRCME